MTNSRNDACHSWMRSSDDDMIKLSMIAVTMRKMISFKHVNTLVNYSRRRYDQVINDCGDDEEDDLIQTSQYITLVRNLLDYTDATKKTKSVLNSLRDYETHTTKHFKEPEQYNRAIIDRLRHHPVDYLLEKFLNDMHNRMLNVEVRTERAHKTMVMLEERYRNSDKEPIHFQLLKVQRHQALVYYGQQAQVDALIRADKQPDGRDGHLSDIEHTKFQTMTEASIRDASRMQGERILRDQLRAQNKRNNAQTNLQAENSTTNANKRYKPDNGAPNQNKLMG
ncbi:hypothetical protein SARC_06815 [Sphaeroforma arctica JP610]|uniref:Uncharacterized protein n=1 Tax=Sphaeroforma arctica JP610 TaxID=667725 RepID=A0A0L0FXZ4_9EUKA|nr:hypothetical protein SARC_06815 [Sphaeroforma arctica JP610]KNC80833.1 hypothetical protein SARC_06815 [Sphaeroforma arctica JP610]|eukprot:XP_014154735.1 hypothetical protein SARC_06815 [Sphaeroforma arctica JP610]